MMNRPCSALALGLALASTASAQTPPAILPGTITVRTEIIASGLAGSVGGEFQISPTDIVPDGTGRLFVTTLGGVVRVVNPQSGALSTPFLTKAQTVTTAASNGEWGMVSMAFHPDYLTQGALGYGKFYTITTEPPTANGRVVDFSVSTNHQDVIKEWTATNPLADVFSGTVREVMRVGQPGEPHNVFDLAFDANKYLYISSGDGGSSANAAQSAGSIHGKVLRIDPLAPAVSDPSRGAVSANGKYRIPTSNYQFNTPGALREAWATGFRSPFRMNFDSQTGDLWLGDVGAGSIEEIDLVTAGGNYGWPFFEGTRQLLSNPPATVAPTFQYSHNFDGLAVIGGFVYRGSAIPALVGKYVFADLGEGLSSARLYYGDPATGQRFSLLIDPTGDKFLAQLGPEAGTQLPLPERIISIGEDADGELYLAAVGIDPRQGGGVDGMIVRLTAPNLVGDFNGDGRVDAADYTVWRDNVSGEFRPIDYSIWASRYGNSNFASASVPEPTAVLLMAPLGFAFRRRRHSV